MVGSRYGILAGEIAIAMFLEPLCINPILEYFNSNNEKIQNVIIILPETQ